MEVKSRPDTLKPLCSPKQRDNTGKEYQESRTSHLSGRSASAELTVLEIRAAKFGIYTPAPICVYGGPKMEKCAKPNQ